MVNGVKVAEEELYYMYDEYVVVVEVVDAD